MLLQINSIMTSKHCPVLLLIAFLLNTIEKCYVQEIFEQVPSSEQPHKVTPSLEEISNIQDDDKNTVIASQTNMENELQYDIFYDEFDNTEVKGDTMDIIFFGPAKSFMRIGTESVLHLLLSIKPQKVPISRVILAWDMITDGKTAAYLQKRELKAFSTLLNVVPEEDLYYVNMADSLIIDYIGSMHGLHRKKLGVLASSYRQYFGDTWIENATKINAMRSLICGFPTRQLKRIPPKVFKEISVEVFTMLDQCTAEQAEALYTVATHPDAFDDPQMWTSNEIGKLGLLFTCIHVSKISGLSSESMVGISEKTISFIDQRKLPYFSRQQISRMESVTQKKYILRLKLMNAVTVEGLIVDSQESSEPCIIFIVITLLVMVYLS